MKSWIGLGMLAMTAFMFSGCTTYMVAIPSVQGKAYVVRNGSDFWNCDASSGEPVCYQTKKKFTVQPAAAK